MRLAIYAIATFAAGIGFTAIARGVLPTSPAFLVILLNARRTRR